jgi:myo-inositol 2-dehydrogenase/D-chiro-inositol 1-dehydrogenase
MTDRKLGIAVVGCGGISNPHTYALTQVPNARLVATVDIDESRARDFKIRFNAESYSTDIDAVLRREDVEAVVVTTANDTHAALTLKALKAGKHVLVQKPMALNLEQAEEMVAAATAAKRTLMVSFFEFFHPAFARAKQIVDQGLLGDVFFFKAIMAWYSPSLEAWRFDPKVSGGGILFDGHSHHVAYFLHLLGNPKIDSVYSAYGALNSTARVEDTGVTILRTPTALAEISGSNRLLEPNAQMNFNFKERIEIFGSKGTIHIDPTQRPSLKVYAPGESGDDLIAGGWLAPQLNPVSPMHQPYGLHFNPDENPWVGEHQHFVDRCLDGKPVVSDGRFGYKVQSILSAAYASGREGRAITPTELR